MLILTRQNLGLFVVAFSVIILPVLLLCLLLSSSRLALSQYAFLSLVPFLPFTVIVCRIHTAEGNKKLLRLMLIVAGAAGVIAPVTCFVSQAYGLCGLWFLVWSGLLLAVFPFCSRDRVTIAAVAICVLIGVLSSAASFTLALQAGL